MSKLPLNKSDIIEYMAEQAKISKTAASQALNSAFAAITEALRSGNSVSFPGFGIFSVKSRAARAGRNPKTGEPITINASNNPAFKAGKALKDAVNSGTITLEEEV